MIMHLKRQDTAAVKSLPLPHMTCLELPRDHDSLRVPHYTLKYTITNETRQCVLSRQCDGPIRHGSLLCGRHALLSSRMPMLTMLLSS